MRATAPLERPQRRRGLSGMALAETGYGRWKGRTDTSRIVIPVAREQIYVALLDASALEAWLPPMAWQAGFLSSTRAQGGRFWMELTYLDGTKGKSSEHSDVTKVTFIEFVPAECVVQRVVFESDDPSFAGR